MGHQLLCRRSRYIPFGMDKGRFAFSFHLEKKLHGSEQTESRGCQGCWGPFKNMDHREISQHLPPASLTLS